jgi:two-component system, OmpR family, sensor histidine kinase BaeS
MSIGPRSSVRVNLAFTILLTIILSWILSSGIANYLNYLNARSFRQQMLKRPDIYPMPIPEPKFGVLEFLTGRPPFPREPGFRPPPSMGPRPERPPMGAPGEGPHRPSPASFEMRSLLLRLIVALGLAALAAAWLGRKFTRPLTQLAQGAEAFHKGDFAHRIPTSGKNEFAAVATTMNEMARRVSDHIGSLEEDAERRRRFLADIAHELRSPVTTMRTMAGALQDGVAEEPERRERAMSALVRTSERLLRLVQDLMDLAKLDLHELPLNFRQVDLRELVSSAIQSHEAEAAATGIILHPLQTTSPVQVTVDPDRVTQAIDNILENAISYSGDGAEVSVSMENGDPVLIAIRDTGKGIRPEDLPYIFDSFYRADAARTPSERHSGLGLNIARRLVEAHGGTLALSSEENKGTVVEISIPRVGPAIDH